MVVEWVEIKVQVLFYFVALGVYLDEMKAKVVCCLLFSAGVVNLFFFLE